MCTLMFREAPLGYDDQWAGAGECWTCACVATAWFWRAKSRAGGTPWHKQGWDYTRAVREPRPCPAVQLEPQGSSSAMVWTFLFLFLTCRVLLQGWTGILFTSSGLRASRLLPAEGSTACACSPPGERGSEIIYPPLPNLLPWASGVPLLHRCFLRHLLSFPACRRDKRGHWPYCTSKGKDVRGWSSEVGRSVSVFHRLLVRLQW